jgi:hypothetical protein
MESSTRTLLTENITTDDPTKLENINYVVLAMRMAGQGGSEVRNIRAQLLDGHYVIISGEPGISLCRNLGVNDTNAGKISRIRMHDLAMEIAKERATYDRNQVLDLTSMCQEIPFREGCFIPDKYLEQVRSRIK